VNKRKIRAKDAVNTVWWFQQVRSGRRADVSRVLTEYSDRMKKKLLKDSQEVLHTEGEILGSRYQFVLREGITEVRFHQTFCRFQIPSPTGRYLSGCRVVGAGQHPARFPAKLPQFFIRFLTDPGDIVLDIFAGSNTTGFVAEHLHRRWLAFEGLP